ncbi:long-chain fatty acid--CoA ligase [uncultured Lactobacillus sp.]|uniref:AMP-dependent synthetase/ligase n=1 Tax=uncultured Lactobacillus sp. TaxID=153152 RepID=UPI00272C02EC|nr:AMP-binding protein [uncultured Lactobacillus sp.]MCX4303001.1 AMP-binding protein [Clostridia bacterium]
MKETSYSVEEVKNFKELLNHSINLYGDNNIFKFKKRMYKKGETVEFNYMTYKEFGKEVEALGTALNSLNIDNKRIALISKNRYEWIETYYAVLTGSKIIVPLDKSLPNNEIISLAERSEAEAIVFEDKYLDVIKKIRDEKLSSIKYFINMDAEKEEDGILSYKQLIEKGKKMIEDGDTSQTDAVIDENAMAVMLFTSGTTSMSKAVMLSQRNLCQNALSILAYMKFDENDCTLALLPFHHALPAFVMNVLIYVGATYTFCDGLKYITQNLAEYECTVIVAVPAIVEVIYKRIKKQIEKEGKTKLVNSMTKFTNVLDKLHIKIKDKVFKDIHNALGGHLRLLISAAAPIDSQILEGLLGFGIRTVQGYGLTEAAPTVSIENDFDVRLGSVGKPIKNVEIKIEGRDEQGIGEVLIKGPNVMLGYYKNEEATKEVLVDGWYHTGDLGYLDKDGFLYITGRKKNVIVQKNGKNIFPEELEVLINHIPFVKESIVYGRPTWDNDLDICVKIVYDKDEIKAVHGYKSEEDILKDMKEAIAKINENMPPYKHIRDVIVTSEELIKTTTAKVKRHEEIAKILGENK